MKLLQNGEMYGYEVVAALAKTADGVLDMGQSTLYPMLYNLEAKGLIEGHWREIKNGRKRKYYAITGKGKKRLADETKQWRQLADAMADIGVIGGATRAAAT